jgi:phage terminase Nu1 subunit (DNA packaging protein)
MAKTKSVQTKKKTAPARAANKSPGEKEKPAQVKDEGPKGTTVRTDELAQLVGVTVRRIQQLQQEGVIKPESKGQYDFAGSMVNIVRYYREKADRRKSGDSEEMAKEKLSRGAIRRELEELKLSQVKGELHKAEDIQRVMGAVLTRLRINLLAIPKGVASHIRDEKDTNVIADKIYERISNALYEVVNLDLNELLANEE